ncbi:MAG TPA: hypothetical protein EYN96_02865 [Candidatus Hydrogenedentes bacterium]|nr:hypothetical protein [Candidatus Hydrogenedentota bacterium]
MTIISSNERHSALIFRPLNGESVRLIDEDGQAIFYDLLYRADVVVDTFGECTQGCEDILRLFYIPVGLLRR